MAFNTLLTDTYMKYKEGTDEVTTWLADKAQSSNLWGDLFPKATDGQGKGRLKVRSISWLTRELSTSLGTIKNQLIYLPDIVASVLEQSLTPAPRARRERPRKTSHRHTKFISRIFHELQRQ